MTPGTCGRCQHFARDAGRPVGSCERWEFGYRRGDPKPGELIVEDDEGWGAVMHEDFGCLLFAPRA